MFLHFYLDDSNCVIVVALKNEELKGLIYFPLHAIMPEALPAAVMRDFVCNSWKERYRHEV